MTLTRDALTVMGKTFGGLGCDYYISVDSAISGLGQPARSTTQTDRAGNGLVGGVSRALGTEIGVEVWADNEDLGEDELNPNNFATLLELRGLMYERPDPTDYVPLSWAGLGWPGEHRVYVRPEACTWLTDAVLLKGVARGVELLWLGDDPVIYSETATTHTSSSASSHSITLTNDGTRAALLGRACTLALTASGTVTSPYVEIDGRRTTWRGLTLTSGQVLNLDSNRRSYVGSQGVDALTRGNGLAGITGSPAARWPLILPGDNDLVLGAASGSFSVSAPHRSTW